MERESNTFFILIGVEGKCVCGGGESLEKWVLLMMFEKAER